MDNTAALLYDQKVKAQKAFYGGTGAAYSQRGVDRAVGEEDGGRGNARWGTWHEMSGRCRRGVRGARVRFLERERETRESSIASWVTGSA